jgi:hypothetical protein
MFEEIEKIHEPDKGERSASRVTDQEMNEHKALRSFGIKPKLGHGSGFRPRHFFDIPNMMFVAKAFGFLASRWVSLVGQFSITIYGYVTASAQLLAYRDFARAGDSHDKIISLPHGPFLDT